MKSLGSTIKLLIGLSTLLVAMGTATAGELSIDDRREAKAFCTEFAYAATSNAEHCDVMGSALDAAIERRAGLIVRVANMDDAVVKEHCSIVLAAAGDAFLGCFDDPNVMAAFDKLKTLEERTKPAPPPVIADIAPETVQAWNTFCSDLKTTVDSFDLEAPKCGQYAEAIQKVADKHSELLASHVPPEDQISAELYLAMATCAEAFMKMPEGCAMDEKFGKALHGLVPNAAQ